jgi:serine-type D-Ala-D-Ala endopeptidase (penicillin-binding protein 7)
VVLRLLRSGWLPLLVALAGVLAFPNDADAASARKSASAAKAAPARSAKAWAAPSRKVAVRRMTRVAYAPPPRPSYGDVYGLHRTDDPLDLASGAAFVVDQDSHEVLFSKNAQAVLPIASLTKLMSALVVAEAGLPLDEALSISAEDIDTEKGSRSRLTIGTTLSRMDLMHLSLMASENRAANALGRHFPGGLDAFVQAMNRKAADLGMRDTRFVEPTGLSSSNQSSARDLAVLVGEAHKHELLRSLSTSPSYEVAVGERQVQFRNTNRLVDNPTWQIGLQKTGYISEAGRCLVMQAQLAGRKLIMVLLDSAGKYSRLGDAERIRRWLSETAPSLGQSRAAAPAS